MAGVRIHPTAEVSEKATIGEGTTIWHQAQVREDAKIGKSCVISKNVYIDRGVIIGNNVKIQNNCSLYYEAILEDGVFIGPHVCFTNDKIPRAVNPDGSIKGGGGNATDWKISKIVIKKGATLGANSTIIGGITIGEWALVGAGSVVTKDVPAYALVYGNPARFKGYVCKCGNKLIDKCSNCKVSLSSVKK